MVAGRVGKGRKKRSKRKRTATDELRGVVQVKLGDGTVRYRASIPGGRRGAKKWTQLVDTPELAAELRKRTMQKLDVLPTRTVTFEEAVKATREDFERRCRPATLQWFDYQVPTLTAFFGRMLVAAITPQDVERFAAQQIATGVSAGTVLHRRRGLRCVLSHAADQLERGDPLAKCRKGTWPKLRKGRVTAPEFETIRLFLKKIAASRGKRGQQDHDIVAAIALTGLRRSELGRLRAEDLRPGEDRVFVTGKVRDEWLPVNAEAMAVLQRMAERVGKKGLLVPGGYVEVERVFKTRSKRHGIKLSAHPFCATVRARARAPGRRIPD
jgi:integrase